jgi:hypothetical protein
MSYLFDVRGFAEVMSQFCLKLFGNDR